ncbi:MAG TPA: NADH-quinone oxidoreductase subunit A [Acidimicrobiales bacterium]|nr:NADH-quinone oxidoreductase subunit A [Acidimicrobiales bacterium]
MDQYLPIFLLLVLGALFAGLSFLASGLLAPRQKPSAQKIAPYECGIVPSREPPSRFPVRFYLVAMIFIIFDIEIVFLYPFAVVFRQLRAFGLVEVLVFAAVVLVAFVYLVSNGALQWGPGRRLEPGIPTRTTESTITRVPTEPGAPGQAA